MDNLITMQGAKPTVSTLIIAKGIGITNRAVVKQVQKYKTEFKELGVLAFEMLIPTRNFKGGKPQKYALLNEAQATFLLTLSKNTQAVVAFKLRLTKSFNHFVKQAEHRASTEWQQARSQGKVSRREETDAIQSFVEYAKLQGSRHAANYYQNFTKSTYKALFIVNGSMAGFRERLDPVQLSMLATAEYIANQALHDGMSKDLPYKDVFMLVRDRLAVLGQTIGRISLLEAGA